MQKFDSKVAMTEFGFVSNAQAPAFDPTHHFMDYVAPKNVNYVFREELLKPFICLLYTSPSPRD